MSYLPFCLSFIIVFCWPTQSVAELYRWTDAQGVVHFADQKPAETAEVQWSSGPLPEASTIQTRLVKPFAYGDRPSSNSSGGLSARQTRTDQACTKVKADLARVQSRLRAGYREPRGNRLRERRRRLRKRYARECR